MDLRTQLAFAAYRPRNGAEAELVHLLREDLATLRRGGHVTARAAPLIRTDRGEFLVVLEWSTQHAVDDAHADPDVLAVWERKGQLADYVSLRDLAASDVPFARWDVVEDL
jgi:hypothetical protein